MVYWMIGLFTTLVAFPKVMLKRQRAARAGSVRTGEKEAFNERKYLNFD
jgi:hypothetical protein